MQGILSKLKQKSQSLSMRSHSRYAQKNRNDSTWRIVGYIASILVVSAASFAYLSCEASADAEVKFEVSILDTELLEVQLFNTDGTVLGNTIALDVMPSPYNASFNEKSMVVSVGTNNEWGYNLQMTVTNTALTSSENNTIANLAEKDGGYTCTAETAADCDFTVNSWGFKIDKDTALLSKTNYIPVPSSLNLNSNSTETTGDPTYLTFGSRINASQAPGEYSTTINFVATAKADPTPAMQEMNGTTIANYLQNTGDTVTMKDTRDGSKYTIGKLADGNYWMLDNLALDLTDSTVLSNMSSSNTNASDTTLGYLKNGGGTSSDKYAITGVVNWTDSTSYASSYSNSDPLVDMASKDVVPSDEASTAGGWKVGGYYNYCAASAGSYCYGNGADAGTSTGNATEDICPKGWRMPTGDTTGEYAALANAIYGSTGSTSDATATANFRSALHLPLSGYFSSGVAYSQGSDGSFWSSTRNNHNSMYILVANESNIYPSNYGDGRRFGDSVRCVLDIPVMQEMDETKIASYLPNVGDTVTMKDSRDDKFYTIGKLADGNYWMLDNLALDLTDSTVLSNMSGSNTHASDTTLNYLKNGGGTSSDKYAITGVVNWTDSTAYASSYSYSDPLVDMDSKDVVPSDATSTAGGWKVGGYYNYCAASAGSYCYDSSSSTGNATEDICPAGWRMPTGGSSGEYKTLYTAYSSTYATFRSALHLPLSGYFYDGSKYSQGSYGVFWSSTQRDDSNMYRLHVDSSDVWAAGISIRSSGRSVRCILGS